MRRAGARVARRVNVSERDLDVAAQVLEVRAAALRVQRFGARGLLRHRSQTLLGERLLVARIFSLTTWAFGAVGAVVEAVAGSFGEPRAQRS